MKFELFDNSKLSPVVGIIRMSRKGHKVFLKYYCGFSVRPDQWNDKTERVREVYGIPFKDYNNTIDKIEATVKLEFKNHDYFSVTSDSIRHSIDAALKRKVASGAVPGKTFSDFQQNFIDTNRETKGYDSVKSFITTKKKLPENISWYDFDYSFYLNFVSKMEAKGFSKNYIGRQVNNIKIILSRAYKQGLHTNQEYLKFDVLKEDVYNIYLSEAELIKMYNLKLTGSLDHVRDLFMLGAWTGMRVSNYLNIDSDINVDLEKNIITAIVNKNGPRVKIPIHWIIREIIDKNGGKLPKSLSEQKLNKKIKDVGRLAGITEKVISVKTIGGKRTEIVREKCEMISSHTCRRSLATNLYLKDVPIKYIMSITGHRTEAQCLKYIKSGIDEIYDKVAELDFWKKDIPVK